MVINGYTVCEHLGTGGFGTVFRATNAQSNSFAMKVTWVTKLQSSMEPAMAAKAMELLEEEVAIFAQLCEKPYSQHILKVYRFMKTNQPDCRFLITEFCNFGNLRNLMRSNTFKGRLDEKTASGLLAQVLEGFRLLLNESIMHRDIKPDNIFIRSKHSSPIGYEAVIGDFGSARRTSSYNAVTSVGTLEYAAPEASSGQYSNKIDIFALGITFFEVLVGQSPLRSFQINTPSTQVENKQAYTGRNLYFPAGVTVSSSMKDLLKKMTDPNQNTRISWNELYRHPAVIEGQKVAGLQSGPEMKVLDQSFYLVPGMFCKQISGKMEIRNYFTMMSSMIGLLANTIGDLTVSYKCFLSEDNKLKLGRFLALLKILLGLRGRNIAGLLRQFSQGNTILEGIDPVSFQDFKGKKVSLDAQLAQLTSQDQQMKSWIQNAIQSLDTSKELTTRVSALSQKNPVELNFESPEMVSTVKTICQGILSYSRQSIPNQATLFDKTFKRQLANFCCMYNYEQMIKLPETTSPQSNFSIQFGLDEANVELAYRDYCIRYE